jgi:DnaJ-class molecular chaperone
MNHGLSAFRLKYLNICVRCRGAKLKYQQNNIKKCEVCDGTGKHEYKIEKAS